MTEQMLFDLGYQTIMTSLYIIGPCLFTAIVVGVAISIFQAITSIQDMTLTFVPKVAAVSAVLILLGNWMLEKLLSFTVALFMNLDKFAD